MLELLKANKISYLLVEFGLLLKQRFFNCIFFSISQVWYDFDYKLFRVDYKPLFSIPPLNSLNPISEIHDYNSGK